MTHDEEMHLYEIVDKTAKKPEVKFAANTLIGTMEYLTEECPDEKVKDIDMEKLINNFISQTQ